MSGNPALPGWYCADCGSTDIHHDAVAQWNPEKKDFEIVAVYDDCWCVDCEENNPDILPRGSPVWGVPDND